MTLIEWEQSLGAPYAPFVGTDEWRLYWQQDADCPTEAWWDLAAIYPIGAMRSPLFAVLTLEAPERWTALVGKNAARWAREYLGHIPAKKVPIFIGRCIERVLPNIPRNSPMRTWAKTRINLITGHATSKEARQARTSALALVNVIRVSQAYWAEMVVAAKTIHEATNALLNVRHSGPAMSREELREVTEIEHVWLWEEIRSLLPADLA